MVAFLRRQRLILPLAPTVAGLLAILAAVAFALLPERLLDAGVSASGLPAILPVAEPPLGATARAALVLVGGGAVALVAGLALFLVFGGRALAIGRPSAKETGEVPVLRRADAHPDAPARAPLSASRDLATPGPIDAQDAPPETTLPTDLDQPLAAYDPGAVPAEPLTPSRALPALARPQELAPGERLETFALAPPPPAALEDVLPARPAIDTDATLHALLERLERGVAATGRPPTPFRSGQRRNELPRPLPLTHARRDLAALPAGAAH